MLNGELKPILTALVMPPTAPLLLAIAGCALVLWRRWKSGVTLAIAGIALLWFLSCHAVAMRLSAHLLPPSPPISPQQLQSTQAIVVLGGGILEHAPEYGSPQPTAVLLQRLRYGAWLARRTDKPLAFSGGLGWAAVGSAIPPEAPVATAALAEFGVVPRWADDRSRDTAENAREMRRLLAPHGVKRIALVTHTWHMPRAELEFRRAGFDVVPAPTGFPAPQMRPLLTWLPSSEGLALSRLVLREALGLLVAQHRPDAGDSR